MFLIDLLFFLLIIFYFSSVFNFEIPAHDGVAKLLIFSYDLRSMFAKTITPIAHNLNLILLKNINSKCLYCSLKTYSTFNFAQNVLSLYGSSLVHHQITNSSSSRSFNFIQLNHNTVLVRHFAKSKDKGKEKKKGTKPKVVLTDEEMSDVVPIYELKEEINKIIDKLKSDCAVNLSIRSNNSAIDK